MRSPENIRVGARVEILQPDYAAGRTGIIRSQEELADGQLTERWIIEILGEDVVLSLSPEEFRLLD